MHDFYSHLIFSSICLYITFCPLLHTSHFHFSPSIYLVLTAFSSFSLLTLHFFPLFSFPFIPFPFSMNDSIEATAKDPVTGNRYFQPTVFAAPKHPASPVFPPRTLDLDSMPTESSVEGEHTKCGGNNTHHMKGSLLSSVTLPSTSTSSYSSTTISTSIKTNASACVSMSKNIGRSVSTDRSTGVSSRVRRTPEEVSRALTNTQSSLSHRQKSSQLQVELQPQPQPHHQHEVCVKHLLFMCVCVYV